MPLGEHRRLAVAHVELARVKAIRDALGGTVNDVVLALVTAGLRRLLLARDEIPPAAGLRAMVPVNVRPPSAGAELGNQVSSLFVDAARRRARPRASASAACSRRRSAARPATRPPAAAR